MEILIENNRVMIDQNIDHINNVSYSYTPWKDNVTLFINNTYKMAPIREIVVNGVQMTAQNIDELFMDLFKENTEIDVSQEQSDWLEEDASKVSHIRNRPYSKQDYSEILVFPEAICVGHTLDIIKEGKLYQTYQWNGGAWVLIGLEPNLIFRGVPGFIPFQDSEFSYFKVGQNNICHAIVEKKGSLKLTTSEIIKNDYSLPITWLNFYVDSSNGEKEKEIADFLGLHGLVVRYLKSGLDPDLYEIENIYLKKMSSFFGFAIYLDQSNLYLDDIYVRSNKDKGQETLLECASLVIKNTDFDYCDVGIHKSPIEDSQSNIDITNSHFYRIELNYKGVENSSITLKNNDFGGVYIYGNNNNDENSPKGKTNIENLDIEFDTTKYSSIHLFNLSFSESAFTNLMNVLTSVTVNSLPLTYKDCTPALTEAQKTQIAAAGWKLQ